MNNRKVKPGTAQFLTTDEMYLLGLRSRHREVQAEMRAVGPYSDDWEQLTQTLVVLAREINRLVRRGR